jgi:catechol 2,3-dioxygenase-like lactoylglutathione lyase family enzyme
MSEKVQPVLQLRVALTTSQYERLVEFYCAGLGLEPAARWEEAAGQGLMLEMGRASLEIFNPAYAAIIDNIETGFRTSGPVRLALEVPDLAAALERLVSRGAVVVNRPVVAPWGDTNARVQDPDGMQITVFQSASPTPG